ncbi:hypothetical protein B0T24DRAFT_712646 [Lasiosphaeria ovina]|uniref:Extracellular membrane protein CFEM domain-containing protein n=1 Tax=Lasiosphaeria ovina TaxID=92902 RepID=A0AAE0JW30_9PEZI|nr:hypothetical protein B0T24DRAFT_712646 [Lasiosphaeria ovina]
MRTTLKALILGSLAILWPVARASPQTIASTDPFQHLRPCASSCFRREGGPDLSDTLGITLKCCEQYLTCHGPVDDECYCRADLQPSAVSWLSLCVATRCTSNAADFTSAVAVYDGYCSAAVGPANPDVTEPPAVTTTPSGTVGPGPGNGNTPPPMTTTVTQSARSGSSILAQKKSVVALLTISGLALML